MTSNGSASGRPRIGITSGETEAWGPLGTSWLPFARAVHRAGGHPIHLSPDVHGREGSVLAELDALLFTGGDDVDLRLYPNPPDFGGEDPETVMQRHRMKPTPVRDRYELALFAAALDRDLPMMGVCRGCQLMNVGLGGRLILDIEIEVGSPVRHRLRPGAERWSCLHALSVTPGTLLAGILPPERHAACNSRHHQAVRVDEAFTARVAAVSPEDGLVEAIEIPGRRWAVGVQWHPEHAGDPWILGEHAPLFEAFVRAALEGDER